MRVGQPGVFVTLRFARWQSVDRSARWAMPGQLAASICNNKYCSRSIFLLDLLGMKKLVVRFLLLLLPLQFLWAGAALACQHEPERTAIHFGHHSVAKSQSDQKGDTRLPVTGGDCSVCHLAPSQVALADVIVTLVGGKDIPPVGASPRPIARWPDRPDRPNWHPPS